MSASMLVESSSNARFAIASALSSSVNATDDGSSRARPRAVPSRAHLRPLTSSFSINDTTLLKSPRSAYDFRSAARAFTSLRIRIERELVAFDRAVLVTPRFEEPRRAHPLLRAEIGRRSLERERFDRRERGVRIAGELLQMRKRFERARIVGLEPEDLFVGLHRAIG